MTLDYYHYFMIAKAEEDAIVIDDEAMEVENPLAGLEPEAKPPKTPFHVQLAINKEPNLEDPEQNIIRRLIKFFEYNRKI